MAVTVVSALNVTAHTVPVVDAHPDHEENVLMPARAGATREKDAPGAEVCEKLVVAYVVLLFAAEVTPIEMPVAGFEELTVKT